MDEKALVRERNHWQIWMLLDVSSHILSWYIYHLLCVLKHENKIISRAYEGIM